MYTYHRQHKLSDFIKISIKFVPILLICWSPTFQVLNTHEFLYCATQYSFTCKLDIGTNFHFNFGWCHSTYATDCTCFSVTVWVILVYILWAISNCVTVPWRLRCCSPGSLGRSSGRSYWRCWPTSLVETTETSQRTSSPGYSARRGSERASSTHIQSCDYTVTFNRCNSSV